MKKRLINMQIDVNNEDTYSNAVAIVGILNLLALFLVIWLHDPVVNAVAIFYTTWNFVALSKYVKDILKLSIKLEKYCEELEEEVNV